MLSIWERNNFTSYNYIIIGSGIVGLTTAYYLKKKNPNKSILVLERGLIPTGASTKNAGFACMGSLTEILDDLKTSTEQEVVDLFLLRKKGLARLQSILGPENMGYKANGSYELFFQSELDDLNRLSQINKLLFPYLNQNAFSICNEKIADFGFTKEAVRALVCNHCEGEIDTGLMMKNLIQKILRLGIEIKTGCEVLSFQERNQHVEIVCKDPLAKDSIIFKASKLFICNNAFAKTLLPEADIVPGRGQVMITKPIEGLKCKGIFHFDRGYYYFREYQGCILFGGGRNLDFKTETSTDFTLNQKIQEDLISKLQNLILPQQPFEIDMQWTGIMAFGKSKRPIIEQHSENVFVGVRMGGMGVAIGSEVAYQLSDLLKNTQ